MPSQHPDNVDPTRIVEAIRKHYLNDNELTILGGSRNITNLEVMLWCYERTGEKKLLDLAQTTWDKYISDAAEEYQERNPRRQTASAGVLCTRDLAPQKVYANAPVQSHGVSYAEISKLPAILYLYTGQEEYRKFAVAAQKRVFDHHMLIDGIPSSSRRVMPARQLSMSTRPAILPTMLGHGPTCLQATGDGQYGDAIERACFNAHPGVTKPDWTGIQYFGSPNQVLANLNCDHGTERWFGSRRMAYQPNPAQFIGCCGGNKHRFLPNYVLSMWMETKGQRSGCSVVRAIDGYC